MPNYAYTVLKNFQMLSKLGRQTKKCCIFNIFDAFSEDTTLLNRYILVSSDDDPGRGSIAVHGDQSVQNDRHGGERGAEDQSLSQPVCG